MNLYEQIRAAVGLKTEVVHVVEVIGFIGDGQSKVQYDSGATQIVYGQGVAVGLKAYLRGGVIVGEAPPVSLVEIEV